MIRETNFTWTIGKYFIKYLGQSKYLVCNAKNTYYCNRHDHNCTCDAFKFSKDYNCKHLDMIKECSTTEQR